MLKGKSRLRFALVALILITQLAAGLSLNGGNLITVNAEELSDAELNERINSARDRIAEAEADGEAAQEELNEVENKLTDILDRMDKTEKEIEALEQGIFEIEGRIATQKEELAELDLEVADLQEVIGQRMRVTQRMNNSNTMLEILSESESIVDLVRRMRVINHLSATDAELMDELNRLIERQQEILISLQEEQNELAKQQETLEEERLILDAYQAELEEQKSLLAQEIKRNENIIISEEETIRIAQQQQATLNQNEAPNVTVPSGGGMFIIPLPSGTVTCEWACYAGHSGIDLSSSNRQSPILAAASGVVVTSGWHNAYGNWVVITHNINGQTYSTLYAHMATTPMVSVGETVSQGQQIGIMGSTGNSTGPHLHFEVHPGGFRWGGAVNPRQYLPNLPAQGRWW